MNSTAHALTLLEKLTCSDSGNKRSRTEFLPFVGPWPGVQGEELPEATNDLSPCRFEGLPGDLWMKGWGFYVSRHALDALDIVYTTGTRTENAKDEKGNALFILDEHGAPVLKKGKPQHKKVVRQIAYWTQGSAFNFSRGMMIYDAMIPDGEPWGDSLQRIQRGIQVLEAQPAAPAKDGAPRNPGMVKARLYVTGPDRRGMSPGPEFTTTQDEFVRMLITGEVPV